MRTIYWDTMIHAYFLEGNAEFAPRVRRIHDTMTKRGDMLCGSLVTLGELLVRPVKYGDFAAVNSIERFFGSDQVKMLALNPGAQRIFADLRAHHGIKGMDALHLAIAAQSGVDLFLTNDERLQRVVMPGLPFIASLETDLFPKN